MFICQEFNSVDKKVKVPEKWKKMSFNEVAIIYFEYLSNLISKYHSYGQDIFFLYCWFYLNLNHLVLSIKTWVPDAGVKTCRLREAEKHVWPSSTVDFPKRAFIRSCFKQNSSNWICLPLLPVHLCIHPHDSLL